MTQSLKLMMTNPMNYTIKSDYYPDYSVSVNGPYIIAFGVGQSIHKEQKINVDIINSDGVVVHSFHN